MRPRYVMTLLCCAAFAVIAEPTEKAAVEASKATAQTQTAKTTATQSPRKACIARCETANGRCNSEVRRGRQECSKKAANNGNNPFTGRPDDIYCGYFNGYNCGYSLNRGSCGQRFARRYSECVAWMRGNIASQRFDCYVAETKAQGLCRSELQDCQAECETLSGT